MHNTSTVPARALGATERTEEMLVGTVQSIVSDYVPLTALTQPTLVDGSPTPVPPAGNTDFRGPTGSTLFPETEAFPLPEEGAATEDFYEDGTFPDPFRTDDTYENHEHDAEWNDAPTHEMIAASVTRHMEDMVITAVTNYGNYGVDMVAIRDFTTCSMRLVEYGTTVHVIGAPVSSPQASFYFGYETITTKKKEKPIFDLYPMIGLGPAGSSAPLRSLVVGA